MSNGIEVTGGRRARMLVCGVLFAVAAAGSSCIFAASPESREVSQNDGGSEAADAASDVAESIDAGREDVDGASDPDASPAFDVGDCSEGCVFVPQGEGSPRCLDGNDDLACGTGGDQCQACGEGEECNDSGECIERECSPVGCEGCCIGDTCVEGRHDERCGSGGKECVQCGERQRCQPVEEGPGGSCRVCNGCWDMRGECRTGDSSSYCGRGGVECESCSGNEVCVEGSCFQPGADLTCESNECVAGGQCESGESDDACGSGGDYCRECPEGHECRGENSRNGCELELTSRWDVVAVRAEIPGENGQGEAWDAATLEGQPEADPYLTMFRDSERTGKTAVRVNTHTPYWNQVVAEGIRAEVLVAEANFELHDQDTLKRDDVIVDGCSTRFEEQDFDPVNRTIETTCVSGGDSPAPVEVTVWFRLEPA